MGWICCKFKEFLFGYYASYCEKLNSQRKVVIVIDLDHGYTDIDGP